MQVNEPFGCGKKFHMDAHALNLLPTYIGFPYQKSIMMYGRVMQNQGVKPVAHRTTPGVTGERGYPGGTTVMKWPTKPSSRVPSRPSTPECKGAPSSANPGDLPLHVHASGEPWVDDGELDSQPDKLDHGLNPLESSNHSS